MSDSGELRRRYGEKEVGLILKRAAELQREASATTPGGGGFSLGELEEIAEEAGIDPRYLRQAASELDTGAAGTPSGAAARFLGGPLTIELERSLAGELAPADFEGLVPDIQRAADALGQASLLGHTLTWHSSTPQGERSLQITVSSTHGRTRIRIQERLNGLAGALFGGFMGGGGGGVGLGIGLGVGLGALGSAAFAIAFPVAVIGGSYVAARTLFGSLSRRRQRVLRELMDRLTEHIETISAHRAVDRQRGAKELPSG